MMKRVVVIVSATMMAGSALAAGDAAAGKTKAAMCVACHGANGVSTNELWPSLAAQGNAYLVKQLKAFRDGTRKDPLMEPMAKPLSDKDIEDISAYYSTLATTSKK